MQPGADFCSPTDRLLVGLLAGSNCLERFRCQIGRCQFGGVKDGLKKSVFFSAFRWVERFGSIVGQLVVICCRIYSRQCELVNRWILAGSRYCRSIAKFNSTNMWGFLQVRGGLWSCRLDPRLEPDEPKLDQRRAKAGAKDGLASGARWVVEGCIFWACFFSGLLLFGLFSFLTCYFCRLFLFSALSRMRQDGRWTAGVLLETGYLVEIWTSSFIFSFPRLRSLDLLSYIGTNDYSYSTGGYSSSGSDSIK